MTQNRAAIEQNMRNQQVTEQLALDQEQQFKVDQQIASLVETYNDLMDKQDYLEAETVAKQVATPKPLPHSQNTFPHASRRSRMCEIAA